MDSLIAILLLSVLGGSAPAVLDARTHYLGLSGEPEWLEPASPAPEASDYILTFSASANRAAQTLFIRQRDVKWTWPVLLNGRKLGALELNEIPLTAALEIPAGSLREGENTLHILSPQKPDDISIEEVRLDPRPPSEALAESTVHVRVHDRESASGLPCRITIVDARHFLAPLRLAPGRTEAARTGVIYTGTGETVFTLPAGTYTLHATRGMEYSLATQSITVAARESREVELELTHEVPTPGLVAFDPHIHTFTYSRHGDATVEERMLTLAGEGIELACASDHNQLIDYREAAHRTGMDRWFTSLIGDEVTTTTGHFIAFPFPSADTPAPDHRLASWPELFASMRRVPGLRMVILNHPRDLHDGFIPFGPGNFNPATGENLRGPAYTFDGIEVVNSGTLQSDYLQSFRDWFTLLNRGGHVTGIGSSDSHDVGRFIVGQGRTYIACDDRDPSHIDVNQACTSLLAGHAMVSMGLLPQITVEDKYGPGDRCAATGREIHVHLRVLGPGWIKADHLALYANGELLREQSLPTTTSVEKSNVTWTFPKPARDTWLVAIATGPAVEEAYWKIPSPYQPTAGLRHPRVIGATNPVWINVDGDR